MSITQHQRTVNREQRTFVTSPFTVHRSLITEATEGRAS